MAITNGYATLAELKQILNITNSEEHDSAIERAIEAASRAIDQITGYTFFTDNRQEVFTAHFPDQLRVPPCVSVTAITTDSDLDRTWGTNLTVGTHVETEGTPIHTLHITPGSGKSFPTLERSVRVTADWGYSATAPADIAAACRLGAARIFRRKDAVFGTVGGASAVGTAQVQTTLRQDVDFVTLLEDYLHAEVY